MRIATLVFVVCLLFGGCKRHTPTANTPPNQSGIGSGVAEDKSQALAYLEKGKLLYRDDQDEEAAKSFEQAVELDPNLAEAHFRLGLAYEALAKADEAEAQYKKAVEKYKKYLESNQDDAEAHYDLGQTYANLHQYSDAIREYRQALKLKNDDAEIYYDLGMALTRLAQYDEAVTAFSKSLELDPENYRAEDALDEAREGAKRIKVGKKHAEDLLKKQKEEELKKAGGELPGASPPRTAPSRPTPVKKP